MDRTTLKQWFRKGKKPTEQQFATTFDSFWHKEDDTIRISDISGLNNELAAKQPKGNYAASNHGHSLSEINGLVAALNGKSGIGHAHSATTITGSESYVNNLIDKSGWKPALLISNVSSVGGIIANAGFSSDEVELDDLAMTYFPVRISYGIERMYFPGLFYSTSDTRQTIYMWRGNQVVTFTRSRSTPNDSYGNTWNASEQDVTNKQDKTDNALQTSAKTIVGAVNELWNRFTDYIKGIKHVTYAQLTSMRDGGTLVAGQWYRITDYETTVANDPEARSAGHPFDLLVMATSNTTLSEEARAIKSSRDQGYFANSNLDAWKIWYCLDNDVTRFAWADENGTGVIYRMIDEWQNDCPYDFKNIQFKRYRCNAVNENLEPAYCGFENMDSPDYELDMEDSIWAYTFSLITWQDNDYATMVAQNVEDASLKMRHDMDFDSNDDKTLPGCYNYHNFCEKNSIQSFSSSILIDEASHYVRVLNNIVMYAWLEMYDEENEVYSIHFMHNNLFGINCANITMGNECYSNTFGYGCKNVIAGNMFHQNTFGNGCGGNTFGNDCYNNTFGNGCWNNTFGNNFRWNTFGNGCDNNTFGNNVRQLTIFEGVQYVSVTCIESGSSYIQNAQILNGTIGKSDSNRLQISFQENAKFCQIAGLKSDGSLRIWNPADGA